MTELVDCDSFQLTGIKIAIYCQAGKRKARAQEPVYAIALRVWIDKPYVPAGFSCQNIRATIKSVIIRYF